MATYYNVLIVEPHIDADAIVSIDRQMLFIFFFILF